MNNICINQVGRYYNGHCHSQIVCEEALHLNHRGASQGEIARELKTSRGLLEMWFLTTTKRVLLFQFPRVIRPVTQEVIDCIEIESL